MIKHSNPLVHCEIHFIFSPILIMAMNIPLFKIKKEVKASSSRLQPPVRAQCTTHPQILRGSWRERLKIKAVGKNWRRKVAEKAKSV